MYRFLLLLRYISLIHVLLCLVEIKIDSNVNLNKINCAKLTNGMALYITMKFLSPKKTITRRRTRNRNDIFGGNLADLLQYILLVYIWFELKEITVKSHIYHPPPQKKNYLILCLYMRTKKYIVNSRRVPWDIMWNFRIMSHYFH